MNLDWYPFYARHFRQDTLHLTLEQDGAYRRLIDEYMLGSGALPSDDMALARIVGVPLAQWMLLAPVLRVFFSESHGKLIQKRCEEVLHAQALLVQSKSIKAKRAANSRWVNHRENQRIVASALLKQSGRNANGMQNDAIRQDISITSTSSVSEAGKKTANNAGSLASALPTGALASQLEGGDTPRPKTVSQLSRAEIDEAITKKRQRTGSGG